jgi:putative redox protein
MEAAMVTVTHVDGMQFVGRGASGHDVVMDASEKSGGRDSAARPVEALLASLGACTGMDVVSILRKSRHTPSAFRIEVADERAAAYPQVLKKIHLAYVLSADVPREQVERAIELSLAKYCPIANSLAGVAEITYELRFE